jgi:MoxR-like ATPase
MTQLAKIPAQAPVEGPGSAGLLAALGLHGLAHLDAPVLAALATETPMLLIGPHGSAKSALLERLASTLGMVHRHYNASLLSFDDLVGFPVPEGDGLRYLRTPATLWEAQSVFLDEISRCRPEVQNKLFSIIQEKRVQGIALEALRFRWAAMNPPSAGDAADEGDAYAGSMPLDPALADRFGFVLTLPALEELPPEARRSVIRSGLQPTGAGAAAPDLAALVQRCRQGAALTAVAHGEWITAYTGALVLPLREAGLALSGRRAAMLAANIAAVHAARLLLQGAAGPSPVDATAADTALADAALVALRTSLPQRAQGKAIDGGLLATIHRQAVDAVGQSHDDPEIARILDEAHPVRRVGLALRAVKGRPGRVPRHTMSLLVADALASQSTQARWVLSQELLPEIAALDCVDAPTLELMSGPFLAQVEFEQRSNLQHQVPRSRVEGFNLLVKAIEQLDARDPAQVALGNLGAALYMKDEGAADPAALQAQQRRLRALLDVAEDHAA